MFLKINCYCQWFLHIPDTAKQGETITIKAEAFYLVCYQVCIPESAEMSLAIDIGEPVLDARWNANINLALKAIPKKNSNILAAIVQKRSKLALEIKAAELTSGTLKNPYFFPYVQDMIDADALQTFEQFKHGIRLALMPGWKLEAGLKDDVIGVISFEQENGYRLAKTRLYCNSQSRQQA